jgi:hypothetical protein
MSTVSTTGNDNGGGCVHADQNVARATHRLGSFADLDYSLPL